MGVSIHECMVCVWNFIANMKVLEFEMLFMQTNETDWRLALFLSVRFSLGQALF